MKNKKKIWVLLQGKSLAGVYLTKREADSEKSSWEAYDLKVRRAEIKLIEDK